MWLRKHLRLTKGIKINKPTIYRLLANLSDIIGDISLEAL
jgi:hypothetical protein